MNPVSLAAVMLESVRGAIMDRLESIPLYFRIQGRFDSRCSRINELKEEIVWKLEADPEDQ